MKLYKSVCNSTAVKLTGTLFFAVLEHTMGLVFLLLLLLQWESTKEMLQHVA